MKTYPPLHPLRLENGSPEKHARDAWTQFLAQHPGFDILGGPEQITVPDGDNDFEENKLTGGIVPFPYGKMTARDHMVIAEFVQWLATPCGHAFRLNANL